MSTRPGWITRAAWLLLLAGVSLSVWSYRYLHEQSVRSAAFAFEEECRELRLFIDNRLAAYSALLFGLRGVHGMAGGITPEGFRGYLAVLELQERFTATQSLDFELIGAEGKTGVRFAVKAGRLSPLPLHEPESAVPAAGVLEEMRSGGDLVADLNPTVAQAGAMLPMRLALYGRNLAVDDASARRKAFRGSIGMQVSLADLMREAVSVQALRTIRTRIYDRGRHVHEQAQNRPASHAPESMILDTASLLPLAWHERLPLAVAANGLSASSSIRFGGLLLGLEFSAPASTFVPATAQALPALVLLSGLVISLLLFSLFNSLAASRSQLQQAVINRTREVQAVNRALEQEVEERNRLEREIFHLNVEERDRFGRELREGIGLRLAGVGVMLRSLAGALAGRGHAGSEQASGIDHHVGIARRQAGLLELGLNPVSVEAGGFISALERLAARSSEAFHVSCRVIHDAGEVPQNAVLVHNLYRIVQQAITNAVTHGKATGIEIRLDGRAGHLRLAIVDNGIGWGAGPPSDGIGLAIMRYRCSVLGLALRTESAPAPGGAAVIVEQMQPKA